MKKQISKRVCAMFLSITMFASLFGGIKLSSETEYYAAVLLVQGYSNEEIALKLNYAVGSVKNILVRLMNKLSINNRKEIERYKK